MFYQVMSFSHKNCDQAIREKLSFVDEGETIEILNELASLEFIYEVFIISTCNRVDVVLATRDNFSSYHSVLGIMSKKSELNFYELKDSAKRLDDEEAVSHLFSVVSSLESLVVGESQITGQVKEAFAFSHKNGTAGKRLNRLLSYAIKCAAEVRNATNISKNPISISSVAVSQAIDILDGNISGMTGIVIGAGEMGILAAKHLLRSGCDVVLIGRDQNRVEKAAKELGENVKFDTIENLSKYINRYRLLFTATSSKEPIITKNMIEDQPFERLWFDMAMPKDIEDIKLDKLNLFRIDDLKSISELNHALREEQAIIASDIVLKYKEEFFSWLRALSIEPVIKQMRLDVEDAIEKELKRAIDKNFVPSEFEDNMRKMAQQMFNRFLHDPTQNLRESSTKKKNSNCLETVKNMFNIDTENVDLKKYKTDHHKKGYTK